METIYENESAVLQYDSENQILYNFAKGMVKVNLAKESMEALIDFIKNNPCKATIADISKVTGSFTMLIDYFQKEFFPKLRENNVNIIASVVSNDVFTKFSTDKLMQDMDSNELRTFGSLEEAEKWILSKLSE